MGYSESQRGAPEKVLASLPRVHLQGCTELTENLAGVTQPELSGEPVGVPTGSYCQNLLGVRGSGGPTHQLSTAEARTQGYALNQEKAPPSLLQCPLSDKARWLKRTAYRVQLLDHKQGNKERIWNCRAQGQATPSEPRGKRVDNWHNLRKH